MNLRLQKLLAASGVATFAAALSTSVHAAAPATVSDLASSVNFSDVGLAILAVSGVLITLFVTWKGAKFVIRAVKGG